MDREKLLKELDNLNKFSPECCLEIVIYEYHCYYSNRNYYKEEEEINYWYIADRAFEDYTEFANIADYNAKSNTNFDDYGELEAELGCFGLFVNKNDISKSFVDVYKNERIKLKDIGKSVVITQEYQYLRDFPMPKVFKVFRKIEKKYYKAVKATAISFATYANQIK